MSWKTFYSLEKLVEEGKRLAAGCQTVSFDLFDTLLVRRIHDPDIVKLPVARYISCLAGQFRIRRSWESVQKCRDRLENEQRAETARSFDDHEACYPVFMKKTLQELFGERYSDELLEKVTAYELAMESSMLVPRALLADWLVDLREQNKRILVISDIYLPASHLRELVDRAGLGDFVDEVISSADSFLAKASGTAFPLVQQRFDLEKSSWLHVGDNPVSDGMRPAAFGLQALVVRDASEKFRKSLVKRYFEYGRGRPFYRGRALQQLMLPMEEENIPRPDLYMEGYNFLGPMVGAFVQHIGDESRRLGLSKVFFLSREGYTFKKAWEECAPYLYPDRQVPQSHYLYASRMALAGASCAFEGLTRESVGIAFLPHGNRDFRDIARIFKLDLEALVPHLTQHGLAIDTCLSPVHDGYEQKSGIQLMELLDDSVFQQEIKRQTRPANKALIRYLEECGLFDHEQVAIVDIGWLGTIQRFLYNAIKHRPDCPRLHGFLFGATRGIPYPDDLKNSVQGVIYDRHRFDLSASCILYGRDLFEEACRAPHPTLEGYELTDDGYHLKFRDTEDATGQAEQTQDEYFAPLQQGIVDAAGRFGAASVLLGYGLKDYRPWLHYVMAAKLAFPKTSEVMTIRHKHHLDDFHGSNLPVKAVARNTKDLWGCSRFNLLFNPLLRPYFFWRHVRNVLKN